MEGQRSYSYASCLEAFVWSCNSDGSCTMLHTAILCAAVWMRTPQQPMHVQSLLLYGAESLFRRQQMAPVILKYARLLLCKRWGGEKVASSTLCSFSGGRLKEWTMCAALRSARPMNQAARAILPTERFWLELLFFFTFLYTHTYKLKGNLFAEIAG